MSKGLEMASNEQRQQMLSHPLLADVDSKDVALVGLPEDKLEFSTSRDSIGLQVVDVYLWLINRVLEGDRVPAELAPLAQSILNRAVIDSISMEGMAERYQQFQAKLPQIDDLTAAQATRAHELQARHQQLVDKALGRSA